MKPKFFAIALFAAALSAPTLANSACPDGSANCDPDSWSVKPKAHIDWGSPDVRTLRVPAAKDPCPPKCKWKFKATPEMSTGGGGGVGQ